MAIMLSIAGQTIPVAQGPTDDMERGGSDYRTFLQTLAVTVRWERRVWSIPTELMTATEVTTLRAATAMAAQVSCAGSIIGASPVVCEVLIGDAGYLTTGTVASPVILRMLALTLREAL